MTDLALEEDDYTDEELTVAEIVGSVRKSITLRQESDYPYRNYSLADFFPAEVARALRDLPLPAPALHGVSGKRELHNDTRAYFDAANMAKYPVMRHVAEALQHKMVTEYIADVLDAPINNTYLRLEYAQDVDGFWLEPHTDLGVKKFTCLIYLSQDEGHEKLGTDIYESRESHVGTSPFIHNGAFVFVPADNTWHGFEKRSIVGVRKSIILNYVTPEWRAREQLSFPDTLVTVEWGKDATYFR